MKSLATALKKINIYKADLKETKQKTSILQPQSKVKMKRININTPEFNNKESKTQTLSTVTPQHATGHKSLHGKSDQTPLDVFNLVKRTHTKLIPRPPKKYLSMNTKKLFSKRLLKINHGVTLSMESEEKNMLKGHGPANLSDIRESRIRNSRLSHAHNWY